ncbi:hypothetical protein AAFN75_15630 [Algibacter sp. AS12]|uniref:hypothetical protein n=1 Tax=Algibacter sp. AS12 TaxID=3135773 RepID=UPI00398B52D5
MRNRLATILVLGFLLIIGVVIIYPLIAQLTGYNRNLETWITFIDKTASLFTGIIGVIIGYYFGNNKS